MSDKEKTKKTVETSVQKPAKDVLATKKTKKRLKGKIVSASSSKTVIVSVGRFVKHKRYGKFIKIDKKYKVHDERNEGSVGEEVLIEECRPISKDKHFKMIG